MSTPYPGKFKSTICKGWMAGNCRFGIGCNFAHGKIELNKREQLAKDSQLNNGKQNGGQVVSK